jgi:hypothetical protein
LKEKTEQLCRWPEQTSELWTEMENTTVYLHNGVPNRKDLQAPFVTTFKRTSSFHHLRIRVTSLRRYPRKSKDKMR